MDKKSIIALVLIAVIILLLPYYQELVQGPAPQNKVQVFESDSSLQRQKEDSLLQKNKLVKEKTASESPVVKKTTSTIASQSAQEKLLLTQDIIQDSTERIFTIETPKIKAVISNIGGGSLKSFILKKYTKLDTTLVDMIDPSLKNGLHLAFQNIDGNFINTDSLKFFMDTNLSKKRLAENQKYEISFHVNIKDGQITRKLVFYGDAYHFDVAVKFEHPEKILLNGQYQFGWKNGVPSTESYVADDYNYNSAYVYIGDELESYSVSDPGKKEPETLTGNASWIGIRTKYFLESISNINANVSDGVYLSGRGIKKEDYIVKLYDEGFNVRYQPKPEGDRFRVYLGPLDQNELSKYDNNLDVLIMNNGWYERMFRFLSILILPILEFLYSIIPNYGVVIIIFSILVKIAVFPLTKKSYTSMREMQKINPLLAELKEKYKGDPQRLNKETMKLYKEHGVNPLGGCLPTLLQFPLLIALFIVFRSTIQLRGAMFIPGWITDLSRPDTLFTLPFSLPMYGNEFNLLPILMAITMIFQSKMTMQDPKQKAMVYIMPIFMLVLFNRFPSGLNLYYTMFNLLTIIQQWYINKGSSSEPQPVPVKKAVRKGKSHK